MKIFSYALTLFGWVVARVFGFKDGNGNPPKFPRYRDQDWS